MKTIVSQTKQELIQRLESVETAIGNTPIVDFSDLQANPKVKIYGKLEWKQLSGSVKARAAFGIFKSAIQRGLLTDQKNFLDASSGNTAIAYAHVGKALGISITIVLPENASQKRKDILNELGVKIIYSSPFEGTDGAQELAKELSIQFPNKYYYADQYSNEANWIQHYKTTGPEIWTQTNQSITHFAASLGTTGTFTGVGRYLKDKNPTIQLVALQPDNPMHGLEGWKHLETAKVPEIYDAKLVDQHLSISSEAALELIPKIIEKYNLYLSPSAAASLLGTLKIAEQIEEGVILTTLADNSSKYEEVYQQLNIQ